MKIVISKELERIMKKIKKRDKGTFRSLENKIIKISTLNSKGINYFKNLKKPMSDYKHVHVGSFVLLFRIEDDTIIFDRFVHHDKAYGKKK